MKLKRYGVFDFQMRLLASFDNRRQAELYVAKHPDSVELEIEDVYELLEKAG